MLKQPEQQHSQLSTLARSTSLSASTLTSADYISSWAGTSVLTLSKPSPSTLPSASREPQTRQAQRDLIFIWVKFCERIKANENIEIINSTKVPAAINEDEFF